MKKLSVRQKRLLKMWALNFTVIFFSTIAMFGIVVGVGVGLVMLGKTYGAGAVIGIMALAMISTVAATISYHLSKEKLAKVEREEERVLDALKTDHSNKNDLDDYYGQLMKDINKMRQKMYPNSRKKTWI